MELTITNLGAAGTVLTVVDGSLPGVEELGAGVSTFVTGDCTVAVVGDKPDLAEQLEQAAQTLGALLRKILQKIAARQLGRASVGVGTGLHVTVANNGTNAVRAILGDGVTDEQIEPRTTMDLQCMGYIELRELGHVQQSDDPAQQP